MSTGHITITGVDNGDQTGDVIVTVSATATNASSLGVIEPEQVELAVADDETTPVVTLSLSPDRVAEGRRSSFATASLDHRSSAETTVTLSASPAEAVHISGRNQLIIPAGQTVSSNTVGLFPVDDTVFTESEKGVTISGTATNPQGITGPEDVTLTIGDDEGPFFVDDSISYTFTSGVAASRPLPKAMYGNGTLTYSIAPTPGNGVAFVPGPPARIVVSTTAAAAEQTSFTLTATDADGDTGKMAVSITIVEPKCPGSVAVSRYQDAGIVADCEALLASRDTLRGSRSLNWSEHVPIDNWQGIEVRDNRVVRISPRDLHLSGTIPAELGSVSSLKYISLGGNELTGEIPAELGSISSLIGLSFWDNDLTGQIPAELGNLANLRWLNLYGNSLTGNIPAELGRLSNLRELSISNNQLTGGIPAELGNLANLEELRLYGNHLQGVVPKEFGKLSNLRQLYVGHNQLTGGIPAELENLSNLETLSLRDNRLEGEIPAELGNLSNLRSLTLDRNQLTGEIPAELASLSNLQTLWLYGNQLTGEIPAELGKLSNLVSLNLSRNNWTGRYQRSWGNCPISYR